MADTILHITRNGTLALNTDTVLRYDDTRDVLAHSGETIVYRAQVAGAATADYMVRVPLTADADIELVRDFHTLVTLSQRASGLPRVALAQPVGSISTALVMPIYQMRLSDVIQNYLRDEQYLTAERLAVRAAIDYTYIVESLRELDPPRSCISHKTTDFFMEDGQLIVPAWNALVDPTPEALASEISLFGQIWHALFLEHYGTPPLYPYNDDRWQWQNAPQEGVMSIGLRVLLTAAMQIPADQRYVDENGKASHTALRMALRAWQERLLQTPEELDTLDDWALFGFTQTLPGSYTRTQTNAIWQDLRWRVHRAAGLNAENILSARSLAVNAAHEALPEEDAYRRRTRQFVATGEYPLIISQITAPDQLQQYKETVLKGDYQAAYWVYHHLLRGTASPVERDWITRELEPYTRYMNFMRRYDDLSVLTTAPLPLVLAAAEPVLNDTRIEDKAALHRVIVQCATIAYVRLEQAVEIKSWAAIKQAHGAYRILQEESRERILIDRLRPLYATDLQMPQLSNLLERYGLMHRTYLRVFQTANAEVLRRGTGATQTAALTRRQALETLNLLQMAQDLGLDMSDIADSDAYTRQQWQQMIQDALQALQQVDGIRNDIDSVRAGIDRVDAIAIDMQQLKNQVQGRGDVEGLLQQMAQVSKQVDDLLNTPGDSRVKLTADLAELRGRVTAIEKDVRDQHAALGRLSNEKLARTQRLLDDVKERFDTVEGELKRSAEHEAQVLGGYLSWLGTQPEPITSEEVLATIDELVYALRRCPTDAYHEVVHQSWILAFHRLQTQFNALQDQRPNRLRGRRRQKHTAEMRQIREALAVCENEAKEKFAGYKTIHGIKSD